MPPSSFDAVSCGAVIVRRTPEGARFLLLQYTARHWDFVKGHMEPGEREEETVRRETLEETGIDDLVFIPGFRTWIQYSYDGPDGPVRKKVTFFTARTASEAVRLSDEHIGHAWLAYEEALKRLTYPKAKRVLRKARLHLEKQGEA